MPREASGGIPRPVYLTQAGERIESNDKYDVTTARDVK